VADDGAFDVRTCTSHLAEPVDTGLLGRVRAMWPTFHTPTRLAGDDRAYPILQPTLEKISARIAVSEYARRTLVEHLGGDAVVIPGTASDVGFYERPSPKQEWQTQPGEGGTLAFIGRITSRARGWRRWLEAFRRSPRPGPVCGCWCSAAGTSRKWRRSWRRTCAGVEFLGRLPTKDKARLAVQASTCTWRPTSAGRASASSGGGDVGRGAGAGQRPWTRSGWCWRAASVGRNVPDRGRARAGKDAIELLEDPAERRRLAEAAAVAVRRYDWSAVARRPAGVYEW